MSVAEKINKEIIQPKKMGLLVENPVYKPFRYPWCYDAWLTQQRIHWLPEEVPLGDDVRDWQKNLSQPEKNLLTQIFRFFTQADVEVNNCYLRHYTTVFKPTEVLMMMTAFAAMETVHVAAYSHLLDTIGMPESEYSAFMKYKEMKDKYDYMQGFNVNSKEDIAKTVAVFSAFTEGLQYTITKAGGGWISSIMSGEGLVMNFTGEGKILVQSHDPSRLGGLLGPMLPPRES